MVTFVFKTGDTDDGDKFWPSSNASAAVEEID